MRTSQLGKNLMLPLLVLVLILIGACGGGGGSYVAGTNPPGPATDPTGPALTSTGTVSGFGSVFVNGVKFKTSSATKIFDDDADDGAAINDSALKVGHIVDVKGVSEDATNAAAQSMEMAAEVKGPVDSVFVTATKTLVVMGQTVLVDNNTAIDNNVGVNGVTDLKVGDLVEVHGFRDAGGTIVATRIEKQGAVAKFRVRGAIATLDTAARTFKIGALTVSYVNALVVPAGVVLADGLRVQVSADTAPVASKLIATKVKVKKAEDSAKSELEGVINKFTSVTDFEVTGKKITTTATTVFSGGTSADLKEGVKVEIEGATLNSVLTASKIEIKAGGDNKSEHSANTGVAALVASASLADKTITVLGKKFNVTAKTMFEDKANNTRPFNITNFDSVIKIGVFVQISAFKDGAGLTASRVEVTKKGDPMLQGELAAGASATKLTIGGVDVTIDTGTHFLLDEKRLTDFAAFLAKAPAGTIVKVKTKAPLLATDIKLDATGVNQGEVEIAD